MTGTGNSYKVACWASNIANERGLDVHLQQITSKSKAPDIPAQALVVLSYPTHGFTAPWLMVKVVWQLPRGENRLAVVLPCRAGTRVFGRCLPGFEGTAGYVIAFLLWLKGYAVQAVTAVDMPSNWTAVHWGLSPANTAVISGRAENKVKYVLGQVLDGKRYFSGFIPLVLGLLVVRISVMYLIMAQLILAKLFFASEKCNSCSICQNICPKGSIQMRGNGEKRPYWSYSCDSCMACMNFCPQEAIEVSPLVVVLIYYITSVPVLAYLLSWTGGTLGATQTDVIPGLEFVTQYMYILLAVGAAYWLLHSLFRFRLVRKAIAWLSHTRYFRRYQAPGVTLRDIHKGNR